MIALQTKLLGRKAVYGHSKDFEKGWKNRDPKVNKVAVAYSGGLDSSLAIELLRRKYKTKKILPITIDVGQGEEKS